MRQNSDDNPNEDEAEKASTLRKVEAVLKSKTFRTVNALFAVAQFAQRAHTVLDLLFN